jgi:hypothetical protein
LASSGKRTNLVAARPASEEMTRLLIHVEGETEETFVNEVLAPHLYTHGYGLISARLLGNARQRDRRGGIRGWNGVRKDILNHLKEDAGCLATTMVDYYGLPAAALLPAAHRWTSSVRDAPLWRARVPQADITDTEHSPHRRRCSCGPSSRPRRPMQLKKLAADYGTDAREEVFKALRKELAHTPLWMMLRHGLKVRGLEFRLFYPKPRSSESAAASRHGENRITFRPHFYFGETNQEIDFVVFLNGLPIVALELKHEKNQNGARRRGAVHPRDHAQQDFPAPLPLPGRRHQRRDGRHRPAPGRELPLAQHGADQHGPDVERVPGRVFLPRGAVAGCSCWSAVVLPGARARARGGGRQASAAAFTIFPATTRAGWCAGWPTTFQARFSATAATSAAST